jgi:ribosome recycling factor
MELDKIFEDAARRMEKSLESLDHEFRRIRTGRATPAILEGIRVSYYGNVVPLQQIASVMVQGPRMLVVKPWDKSVIGEIMKAIQASGLGLTPQSDGTVLRIPIPPLSEERRQELVRLIRKLAEDTRVAVRNVRRDALEQIRKLEKDSVISEDDRHRAEERLQKLTNEWVEKVDEKLAAKEKEVLEE